MKRIKLLIGVIALFLGVLVFLGPSTSAQTYVLNKIVDFNDPIPGGQGNFDKFRRLIPLSGENLAFTISIFGTNDESIFTYINGVVTDVADLGTPVPSGTGNFNAYHGTIAVGGNDLAFRGEASSGQMGIYTIKNGVVEVVADLNTAIPGGAGNFTGFLNPISLGGGDLAFIGNGTNQQGVYTFINGTLALVADRSSTIPGNLAFWSNFISVISIGNGDVSFLVEEDLGVRGIYTSINGSLGLVADTGTAIPGGTGNFLAFTQFEYIALGPGGVAFLGTGSLGQEGVYTFKSGVLEVAADLNTAIPFGSGNFTSLDEIVALSEGDIAFHGEGASSQQGIYRNIGGVLDRVADASTPIPAGVGNFTFFSRSVHISGKDLVFLGANLDHRGEYVFIGGKLSIAVDDNTDIPGQNLIDFGGMGIPISLGNGDIAFEGFDASINTGIYTSKIVKDYTLEKVADLDDLFPGSIFNFNNFTSSTSIGSMEIAFHGSNVARGGLHLFSGGTLENVVTNGSTPCPSACSTFGSTSDTIPLGGGDMAFAGGGSPNRGGIYKYTSLTSALSTIVDDNTSCPGANNCVFTGFGNPVSLGDGDIAFFGRSEFFFPEEGVYTSINGTLGLVASTFTSIPGGSGSFENFISSSIIHIGGKNVAFQGDGSLFQEGIYIFINGALGVVADKNTLIPDGAGTFTGFDISIPMVSLGSNNVAFRAFGTAQEGLYASIGGTLSAIADRDSSIPGGTGFFTGFGSFESLGGNDVVFHGFGSGQEGIYTSVGGVLFVVVDRNIPMPGFDGNFESFDNIISLGNGDFVFIGNGQSVNDQGIYAVINGSLQTVVNTNTLIPEGSGNFISFDLPHSLGDGLITFKGVGVSQQGIYSAKYNGRITVVKFTEPAGLTGDFEFLGTGFPGYCFLDGPFTLGDTEFLECNVVPGNYTVAETDSLGLDLAFINCDGGSPFTTNADSFNVDLLGGDEFICSFTNMESSPPGSIVLLPFDPSHAGVLNTLTATDATSNGQVRYIWGFDEQPGTDGSSICPGLQVGISNFRNLTTISANGSGTAALNINVPANFAGVSVVLQAVDLTTCTASNANAETITEPPPPPPPGPLELNPMDPGTAGVQNALVTTGATPNGQVKFIWGFDGQPGTDGSSICPGLQVGILDFRNLVDRTADGSGVATLNINVPANFAGLSVVLQAVDLTTCTATDVNMETL